MNANITLNPNRVVQYLCKSPEEFLKTDIIRFIKENGIRMVNFMYPADDNRLKTLNFVINSEDYLDSILTLANVLTDQVCFHLSKPATATCTLSRAMPLHS